MPKTILIVEDDDEVRSWLCALFEGVGLAVMQASDGRAGLQILERAANGEAAFDLVVLDLDLPIVSGNALLRLATKSAALRGIPFVVVTGKPLDDPERQRGIEHAQAVLEKPINRQMILGIVAHLTTG